LRWLVPLFLALLFITNVLILGKGFTYLFILAAQIIFYVLALVGALVRKQVDLNQVLYVPYYFCLVNIASARGIMEVYVGKTYTTWSTARE
jgi:hypothetical protein